MSDPKPTKRKFVRTALMTGVALTLVGAGAAGGAYVASAGIFGAAKGSAKAAEQHDEKGVAHYYAIEQGFTANLRESGAFVQASVAVSSRGDEKIVEAVKANEPAMRSVVLQILAEQDPDSIATSPGRRALLNKLRVAMNAELVMKVGFGGIDNVYFTAFVLQ